MQRDVSRGDNGDCSEIIVHVVQCDGAGRLNAESSNGQLACTIQNVPNLSRGAAN